MQNSNPYEYIRNEDDQELLGNSWYMPELDRDQVEALIAGCDVGTFFVRKSKTQSGRYAISFVSKTNKIMHSLVENVPGGYRLPEESVIYPTLVELLKSFKFLKFPEDQYTKTSGILVSVPTQEIQVSSGKELQSPDSPVVIEKVTEKQNTKIPQTEEEIKEYKKKQIEKYQEHQREVEERIQQKLLVQKEQLKENKNKGNNMIKLDEIYKWMASPEKSAPEILTFILTYPRFTHETTLLAFLFRSYCESANEVGSKISPTKQKIVEILKLWIQHFPKDFQNFEILIILSNWQSLLKKSRNSYDYEWSRYLLDIMEGKLGTKENSVPLTLFGINTSLFTRDEEKLQKHHKPEKLIEKVSATMFACQITAIDYELMDQINPRELTSTWNLSLNENYLAIRDNYNMTVQWIITTIIHKGKSTVLGKFIQIGHELLKLNNFQGVFKIYNALLSPFIQKLNFQWTAISDTEKQLWEEICNSVQSYKTVLEKVLDSPEKAFIPSFYELLKELESIENTYAMDTEFNRVNYDKLKALARAVKKFVKFKLRSYDIPKNLKLQKYLRESLYFEGNSVLEGMLQKALKGSMRNLLSAPLIRIRSSSSEKFEDQKQHRRRISSSIIEPNLNREKCVTTDNFFAENRYAGQNEQQSTMSGNLFHEAEEAVQTLNFKKILDLLQEGLPFNTKFKNGQSLYHVASLSPDNNVKLIDFIMSSHKMKPDINCRDDSNWTPLHCACYGGSFEVVKVLLDYGANVNVINESGATPLHYLARRRGISSERSKFITVMQTVIERGAYLNSRDVNGETPLHKACNVGNLDAVEVLLVYGANRNIGDKKNETPLLIAKKAEYKDIVDLLERNGSKEILDIPDEESFVLKKENWIIEVGSDSESKLDGSSCLCFPYSHFFAEREHINFIGQDSEVGTVVVSLLKEEEDSICRMLIQSKHLQEHFLLPQIGQAEDILSAFRGFTKMNYEILNCEMFSHLLADAEERMSSTRFIYDILYLGKGQYSLKQALTNTEKDHTKQFNRFLAFLTKNLTYIPLSDLFDMGFRGYSDFFGKGDDGVNYALYTTFDDKYELVFHVNTRLSKERISTHFGKSPVLIIFVEDSLVDLSIIDDFDTDVAILIQPSSTKNIYKVSICYKNCIHEFGPHLKKSCQYPLDPHFRNFLLTKLINAHWISEQLETKQNFSQRANALDQLYNDVKKAKTVDITGRYLYKLEDEIGRGATGIAYLAINKKTKQQYCMKVINRLTLEDEQVQRAVAKEVQILKRLNHKNIVRGYKEFDEGEKLYLLLELCTGGSVFDDITTNGVYNEKQAAQLMEQVLSAAEYMHSKKVSHRDLKPDNLLYSDSSKKEVKIADFGFGKDLLGQTRRMMTQVGTLDYIAPEIINGEEYDYFAIDVWSLGCICYFLLFGYPPFAKKKMNQLVQAVSSGQISFDHPTVRISDQAKAFIKRLICVNPFKRATASGALQDPWILENIKPEESSTEFKIEESQEFSVETTSKSQEENSPISLESKQNSSPPIKPTLSDQRKDSNLPQNEIDLPKQEILPQKPVQRKESNPVPPIQAKESKPTEQTTIKQVQRKESNPPPLSQNEVNPTKQEISPPQKPVQRKESNPVPPIQAKELKPTEQTTPKQVQRKESNPPLFSSKDTISQQKETKVTPPSSNQTSTRKLVNETKSARNLKTSSEKEKPSQPPPLPKSKPPPRVKGYGQEKELKPPPLPSKYPPPYLSKKVT